MHKKMKIIKHLLLIAFLLPCMAWAQSAENIIPNGSFETFDESRKDIPLEWYINATTLFPRQETKAVKDGEKALRLYANGGSFQPNNGNAMPVKAGHKYKLSFWFWETGITRKNVIVTVYWCKEGKTISTKRFDSDKDKIVTDKEWLYNKRELQAPIGIDGVIISIKLEFDRTAGYMVFDDFRLTDEGIGQQEDVPQVSNLVIDRYQRELELSWNNIAVDGYKWEVECNAKTYTVEQPKSSKPSLTVEGLEPYQKYIIKVVTVSPKGSKSDPIVQEVSTSSIASPNDVDRIPFLRKLPNDGFYKRAANSVPTYFTDLYTKGAKIIYLWDGKPIEPKGSLLTFGEEGQSPDHVLQIDITEEGGRQWLLEYYLSRLD